METAPTDLIQPLDKQDIKLNKSVGGALPDSQKPIPLTDELKQIGVDATHVVGSSFDELMGGEGGFTRDRVVESRNPLRLVFKRARGMLGNKFRKAT